MNVARLGPDDGTNGDCDMGQAQAAIKKGLVEAGGTLQKLLT
jgi:hypothetical protein